jgi:hypothetical protein
MAAITFKNKWTVKLLALLALYALGFYARLHFLMSSSSRLIIGEAFYDRSRFFLLNALSSFMIRCSLLSASDD